MFSAIVYIRTRSSLYLLYSSGLMARFLGSKLIVTEKIKKQNLQSRTVMIQTGKPDFCHQIILLLNQSLDFYQFNFAILCLLICKMEMASNLEVMKIREIMNSTRVSHCKSLQCYHICYSVITQLCFSVFTYQVCSMQVGIEKSFTPFTTPHS